MVSILARYSSSHLVNVVYEGLQHHERFPYLITMLVRTAVTSIILHYFTLVISHIHGKSIPVPRHSARTLTSTSTHYLFTISRYEVILSLQNEDPSSNYIPSLKTIAENVTTATSEFLTKCMNTNLALHGVAEGAMDKLQINVNMYKLTHDGKLTGTGRDDKSGELRKLQKGNGMHFKAIIDGHAKFYYIAIPPLVPSGSHADNYRINQKDIGNIVRIDCLSDNLSQYLKHMKDNLSTLSSADVNTNTSESGFFLDRQDSEQGDVDTSESIIVGLLLSLSLLVLVGGLYMYFSHDYHLKGRTTCSEDGHILLSDIETYSDECDEDRLQRLESETLSEKAVFSDDFVAVPARDDEVFLGISKRKKDLVMGITPRRYVQTASPFDVLYGAAFSHRDQDRVEEAHRPKSVKKSLPSRRRSAEKSKPLRPMLAISEEKEYDKPLVSQDPMCLFPQFMSKFSTFLSAQDNQDDKQEDNRVDETIVYRDFPRHDGTPCVMYTPKDEVDWNFTPQKMEVSSLLLSILRV